MRAAIIHTDARIELAEVPIPSARAGEAVIRTLGCGVCGTDVLKINLRMLKKPTVLGHELAGEVVSVGEDIVSWQVGDRLVVAHHVPCFVCHYCRHGQPSMCAVFKSSNLDPGGFAEFVRIPAAHLQHTALKLAPDMDWREAIFAEPLGCCVRNIERLPLLRGDVVVVVGLGSIGLMMASLLQRAGVAVIGVDLDEARCALAHDFGVSRAFAKPDTAFFRYVGELSEGRLSDGVIVTAGPTALLADSLNWIRDGGFVNLFSHLSGNAVPLDTAQIYHRELQIIATYSSSPDSLRAAFGILREGDLRLSRMISGEYGLGDLARAVADINKRRTLKAVIVPI